MCLSKSVQGPLSSRAQPPVKRAKEANNQKQEQEQRTSGCDIRGSGNDVFEFDESELLDIACSCVSVGDTGFLKNATQMDNEDYDNG